MNNDDEIIHKYGGSNGIETSSISPYDIFYDNTNNDTYSWNIDEILNNNLNHLSEKIPFDILRKLK